MNWLYVQTNVQSREKCLNIDKRWTRSDEFTSYFASFSGFNIRRISFLIERTKIYCQSQEFVVVTKRRTLLEYRKEEKPSKWKKEVDRKCRRLQRFADLNFRLHVELLELSTFLSLSRIALQDPRLITFLWLMKAPPNLTHFQANSFRQVSFTRILRRKATEQLKNITRIHNKLLKFILNMC